MAKKKAAKLKTARVKGASGKVRKLVGRIGSKAVASGGGGGAG